MNKLRNIIIIMTIIVFILIVSIIILNKSITTSENKDNWELTGPEYIEDESMNMTEEEIEEYSKDYNKYVNELNDKSSYYDIKTCFNNYLDIIKEDNKQAILEMLCKEYIEENNINIENVENYAFTYKGDLEFEILEFYNMQNTNIDSYAISGILINEEYKYKQIYFIVNLDKLDNVFSIEFVDKVNDLKDIKSRTIEKIEKNEYNTYVAQKITDELICYNYIQKIKILALTMPDELYNSLNEEYKEARFDGLEDFKNYVNENRDEIANIEIAQYQQTKYEDITMYVCKDKKGKFYIINEKSWMDFDIMLDSYTIELPQSIVAYKEADNNKKISMDIQSIKMALNDKNYKYLYNILKEDFKRENFATKSDLENYLKENLYEENIIDGEIKIESLEGYYKCTVNFVNATNSEEKKEVSLYIYLGEGRNFEVIIENIV